MKIDLSDIIGPAVMGAVAVAALVISRDKGAEVALAAVSAIGGWLSRGATKAIVGASE